VGLRNEDVIDCGNSGTGVRLIMGAMAATTAVAFTDASLNGRPMGRVTDHTGVVWHHCRWCWWAFADETVVGAKDQFLAVTWFVPVPSAQGEIAVLLAGLNAPGETVIEEATRSHGTYVSGFFGADLTVAKTPTGG
jgi:3-phosphoshikimate 1-carboxyvinyltransferase